MIKQSLFFGLLKLNIITPQIVNWRLEEKLFFEPVLPVKATYDVIVNFDNELPLISGNLVYQSKSISIFYKDKEERYYRATYVPNQNYMCYSSI